MSLAAQIAAFKAKTMDRIDVVTRLTVEDVGGRLIELSPVGDPSLWQRLPSKDYHPGNFRGNWFYSLDQQVSLTHDGVGITEVVSIGELPVKAGGHKHFIQNSTIYGPALEMGHSTQAPAGVIAIAAIEMPNIAEAAARRVAA
jgi:hypothetical protein